MGVDDEQLAPGLGIIEGLDFFNFSPKSKFVHIIEESVGFLEFFGELGLDEVVDGE